MGDNGVPTQDRVNPRAGSGATRGLASFDDDDNSIPVVAKAMLARGELMPSTAIEGGVDVVVRHLADEEEHAAMADQPPETLAQVTRDGKFTSSIDEKMRFQGIHDGQVLIRYTIHKVVAEDREQPTLIRVPVDGYYGRSGTKPGALEVAPEQLDAL